MGSHRTAQRQLSMGSDAVVAAGAGAGAGASAGAGAASLTGGPSMTDKARGQGREQRARRALHLTWARSRREGEEMVRQFLGYVGVKVDMLVEEWQRRKSRSNSIAGADAADDGHDAMGASSGSDTDGDDWTFG